MYFVQVHDKYYTQAMLSFSTLGSKRWACNTVWGDADYQLLCQSQINNEYKIGLIVVDLNPQPVGYNDILYMYNVTVFNILFI